jgi:hypothetical protein
MVLHAAYETMFAKRYRREVKGNDDDDDDDGFTEAAKAYAERYRRKLDELETTLREGIPARVSMTVTRSAARPSSLRERVAQARQTLECVVEGSEKLAQQLDMGILRPSAAVPHYPMDDDSQSFAQRFGFPDPSAIEAELRKVCQEVLDESRRIAVPLRRVDVTQLSARTIQRAVRRTIIWRNVMKTLRWRRLNKQLAQEEGYAASLIQRTFRRFLFRRHGVLSAWTSVGIDDDSVEYV